MKVILNVSCRGVGKIGETVEVRAGYARNYLIPKGMAVYATESNKLKFQEMRERLMQIDRERVDNALDVQEKTKNIYVVIDCKVGDGNKLFGSVNANDIAQAFSVHDKRISRDHIIIRNPIKNVGVYLVRIVMHPSVAFDRYVAVARSQSEGHDLYSRFVEGNNSSVEKAVNEIKRQSALELTELINSDESGKKEELNDIESYNKES